MLIKRTTITRKPKPWLVWSSRIILTLAAVAIAGVIVIYTYPWMNSLIEWLRGVA